MSLKKYPVAKLRSPKTPRTKTSTFVAFACLVITDLKPLKSAQKTCSNSRNEYIAVNMADVIAIQ